ncbi:MAG: YihY/virulence factor BrkB family protein, partial [Firmicutes bacterium]|nr:YihY/virulence factor BrkB family protein [Bacillota bacterium]
MRQRMRPAQVLWTLWRHAAADDVGAYAAALAYRLLFTVFPLALLITAFLSLLHLPSLFRLLQPFTTLLNPAVRRLVLHSLAEAVRQEHPGLLSLGMAGVLWGVFGGVNALMDALNHAFGWHPPYRRSFWRTRLVALGLGLGFAGLTVLLAALLQAGPRGTPVHWLVGAIGLAAALAVLYRWGPDRPPPWRAVLTGTVVALSLWLGGSWLLTLLTRSFPRYQRLYGALGTVIALLLYLYYVGWAILTGAEAAALRAARI